MLKFFQKSLIPFLGIFLLFFGFNTNDVAASNLDQGLVSYWKLDEGKTMDYVGINNLINYNAVSAKGVHGAVDTAFTFFNASSSHLYINDNIQSGLDINGNMAVSAWVNFESFPKNGNKFAIVAKYNEDIGQRSYFYSIYNDNGNYMMQGLLSKNGGDYTNMFSPVIPLELNAWYNFAWVLNTTNGNLEFYVDGKIIGEENGGPTSLYNSNVSFQIGGYDYSYGPYYFDGIIDEVRIYNRILSEEEIKELYDQFKGEPVNPFSSFTFAHMTDIHIGSSWVPGHSWHESLSYPRFADGLYEISRLAVKPDFLLVSGDAVEYARQDWLNDYKSFADSFTAQSGIPVYTVPGNHDRYRSALGSAPCMAFGSEDCQDGLAAYKSAVASETDLNFTHKGVEFIGLDSGADYMSDLESGDFVGDKGIESAGISSAQLMKLAASDMITPKVAFMHSPVYTGGSDECSGEGCSQPVLEDGSFADNRAGFLNWARDYNLQLVLAGHGHRDEAFNIERYQYSDINNASGTYPLFVQTQSATHDSGKGHGYRLVDAADGKVKPRAATETGEYARLVNQLVPGGGQELRVFSPLSETKYVGPQDTAGLDVPFFAGKASQKILLYGLAENKTKIQIMKNSGQEKFDLNAAAYGIALADPAFNDDFGYRIGSYLDGQFIHLHLENKIAELAAKRIDFGENSRYQFRIDWDQVVQKKNIDNVRLSNVFASDFEEYLGAAKMKYSLIAKLFSPAELLVVDNSSGERTGVLGHEAIEEIPYSLSDSERERVLIYSDEDLLARDFSFIVKGIPDVFDKEKDTFSLEIRQREDEIDAKKIIVEDMPINASTTYRFHVDWQNLSDERGVVMEIDSDGDGVFEVKVELGQEIGADSPLSLRAETLANLKALKPAGLLADKKIDSVIAVIERSLDEKLWRDDYFLNKKSGEKVFDRDAEAIGLLRFYLGLDKIFDLKKFVPAFIENRLGLSADVKSAFADALAAILKSDAMLARTAINDYISGADTAREKMIAASAEGMYAKAHEADIKHHEIQALHFFKQAWKLVD